MKRNPEGVVYFQKRGRKYVVWYEHHISTFEKENMKPENDNLYRKEFTDYAEAKRYAQAVRQKTGSQYEPIELA